MTGHNLWFWVAQILGTLGFVVFFWSSYSVNRRVTIGGRGISSLLFTIEYLILGMWSSAGVSGINAFRGFSMAGTTTLRARRWLMALFLTAQLFMFVFVTGSLSSWLTVLPLIGAGMSTFAFSLTRVSRIKALSFFAGIIWIVFFATHGLWVNVAGNSIAMVLSAIAWRRSLAAEAATRRAETVPV